MKRKSTTLLFTLAFVLFATITNAQYTTLDFESAAAGQGFDWNVFENAGNTTVSTTLDVANPYGMGSVMEFEALQGGQPWAGTFTEDIDPFQFDGTNTTLTMKVYKPVASNIEFKFEPAGGGPGVLVTVANTMVNTWETVTFDFSAYANNGVTYGRMVIIPDFDFARATNTLNYIDDIVIPENNLATGPASAAPTPTHVQATDNVQSIYSGAYTNNLAGTNFNPNWGQTTVYSTTSVSGDDAILYSSFNYQGTEFMSDVDGSNYGYFHLDYWTPDLGTFNLFFVDNDPETPVEVAYSITPTASTWGSVDIPMFIFENGGLDITSIDQIKIDGGSGTETLYLDNLYFHSNYDAPLAGAPTPTHDATANAVVSLFSDSYMTTPATIDYDPFWGQATDATQQDIAGNNTLQYVGLNYQGTDFNANQVDASGADYLHFDYWASSNVTDFRMFLISLNGAGNGPQEYGISPAGFTTGSWQSVDIPLSDFTTGNPLLELGFLGQLKVDDNGTGHGGNVWFDNIYFYSEGALTLPTCKVNWTNLHNTVVLQNGRRLRKNVMDPSNFHWNGGGISQNTLHKDDDGYAEMEVLRTDKTLVYGLGWNNMSNDKDSIRFGVELFANGIAYITENGWRQHTVGAYSAGDIFRIEKAGGEVKYYQNGNWVYTSNKNPWGFYHVDVCLRSMNATAFEAYSSFSCASSAKVSNPTTIATQSQTANFDDIAAFPNPFEGNVTIDYAAHTEDINTIEMYSISGQHIRSIEISQDGQTTIDTGDLEKGFYIISINSTKHLKIVKM